MRSGQDCFPIAECDTFLLSSLITRLSWLIFRVPYLSAKKRLFIFEHAWTKREGYEEVISGVWSGSVVRTKMFQITKKIKNSRLALLKWNREEGFHIPSVLKEKKACLLFLESSGSVMQQRPVVLQL